MDLLTDSDCESIYTVCLSIFVCLCVVGRAHGSSAVGPAGGADAHKTLAKGPNEGLAQGPNKKLLL